MDKFEQEQLVLSTVRYNMFIAGGYVRDTVLKKEWRDIDLYYVAGIEQYKRIVEHGSFFLAIGERKTNFLFRMVEGTHYYGRKFLYMKCPELPNVELMVLHLPDGYDLGDVEQSFYEYVVADFDCHLSRAYIKLSGRDSLTVYLSNDFERSWQRNELMFTNEATSLYVTKISAKYPEWRVRYERY